MSDYLWDKKGEPDAEVARLEALLGAFRHEPRRLELPAEAATPEPPAARVLAFAPRLRASRLLAPAALAAAAALVVAAVLVASLFLRARVADEGLRASSAQEEPARPKAEAPKDEPTQPQVVRRMLEPPPGAVPGGKVKDEKAAVKNLPRVPRRLKAAQIPVSDTTRDGTLEGQGLTFEAMRSGGGASAFVESTRLLTKEQLFQALRLTSAKLKDVRERAQGERSRQ